MATTYTPADGTGPRGPCVQCGAPFEAHIFADAQAFQMNVRTCPDNRTRSIEVAAAALDAAEASGDPEAAFVARGNYQRLLREEAPRG